MVFDGETLHPTNEHYSTKFHLKSEVNYSMPTVYKTGSAAPELPVLMPEWSVFWNQGCSCIASRRPS